MVVRPQVFSSLNLRTTSNIREESSNNSTPAARIIVLANSRNAVIPDQILIRMRIEIKPVKPGCFSHITGVGLAIRILTTAITVVEKGPEAGTVNEHIRASMDVIHPRHTAFGVTTPAIGVIRIAQRRVRSPGIGGERRRAGSLPVRSFRLLHADEDVGGVVEVVLIESIVLKGGAVEPCGGCSFDKHAATGGDGCTIVAIEIVVYNLSQRLSGPGER